MESVRTLVAVSTYCVFDDPISRDNGTSNEEQRAAALAKHGSIMKLARACWVRRERPNTVGTWKTWATL